MQGLPFNVTVSDTADTWGALRVLDVAVGAATQVATSGAERTTTLTPGIGRYAFHPLWAGTSPAPAS